MEENELKPTENKPAQQEGQGSSEPAETQKSEDLSLKLAEAEKQAAYYKDLLLRKAAEFENYKKRVENDSALIVRYANEDLITEILPILDDFERSLKLTKDQKDFETFYKGVELIYQKLLKILEFQGVKPLETVGKEFNVEYHDAVLQIPKADVPPHTVIEEVEKGYTLHDKVIRHAKVIVSASPASSETETPARGDKPPGGKPFDRGNNEPSKSDKS